MEKLNPTRKKILILTEWFHPGFRAGGPITSLVNLVNAIDNADFFVITTNRDLNVTEPYENIETGAWIKYNDNCSVYYFDPSRLNNRSLGLLMRSIHFDVCYMNSIFSLWFTLMPLWWCSRKGHREKVVLAPRGMLKSGALSVKPLKKKLFLRLTKSVGLFSRISWHASSEEEAIEVRNFYGERSRIFVVPNIPKIFKGQVKKPKKEKGILHLISVARISPEKGMAEAIRFLDQIRLVGYNFHWTWIGPVIDEPYFDECLERITRLNHVHFKHIGEVLPHKIPALLEKAHFFYLPTRGENFGHSIFEALSSGTPIIISQHTPWRNLHAVNAGFDLAMDDDEFAGVLTACAEMDDDQFMLFSEGAKLYAESKLTENDSVLRTKEMLQLQ